MALTIRFAKTRDDRERAYKYRYTVYVEEMRRWQIDADHSKSKKWMQTDEALPP
jgi:hypothetical protein